MAFVESDRVPSLLEAHGKAVQNRSNVLLCWNKRKKSKDGGIPGAPGIALCPASVVKTIFLTSKLPPLIISLTFQLASSQLGTPNSGADFLPVSGQPWHACLWNKDCCQLYVWLGSCIWHTQQVPDRACEGRAGHSFLLQAEFGLEQS